jgi:hypothetical protein
MRILFAVLLCGLSSCLSACQFSGGTALPELPGLEVKTPSGWYITTNANTKGTLKVRDGEKEIDVKLTQDVSGVVDSQANLAQGLEGLAKIENARQKVWMDGITAMFGMMMSKVPDAPLPEVIGPVP